MAKKTLDNLYEISVYFLKKHQYFVGVRSGFIIWTRGYKEDSVGLEVSVLNNDKFLRTHYLQTKIQTGEEKEFDYKIPLTTTACYFGGVRYWFLCPGLQGGSKCGKRVGVLYKSGDYFACRHCHNLTYEKRNEPNNHNYRIVSKYFHLQERLKKATVRLKKMTYKGKHTKQKETFDRLMVEIEDYPDIYSFLINN